MVPRQRSTRTVSLRQRSRQPPWPNGRSHPVRMLTLIGLAHYCGCEARGDAVSKGTERFLVVAVIILVIERILFYAVSLSAFVF